MEHPSNILVVSRDQMLLQTRRLILGTYFQVEAAGRLQEAGTLLSRQDFDLIVLCDTLSDSERLQIAEMVRDQKPHPTLLSLLPPGRQRKQVVVGRELTLGGGPLQLLKECAGALGVDLKSKQRLFAA